MMKHINIRVTGRVQGVGYRMSCNMAARQMSVTGFVKNEYDGSVYIEAEGEEENLSVFTAWCRKGPDHAYVEDLNITEGEMKNFDAFEVSY